MLKNLVNLGGEESISRNNVPNILWKFMRFLLIAHLVNGKHVFLASLVRLESSAHSFLWFVRGEAGMCVG